jgi:hypothetical protein
MDGSNSLCAMLCVRCAAPGILVACGGVLTLVWVTTAWHGGFATATATATCAQAPCLADDELLDGSALAVLVAHDAHLVHGVEPHHLRHVACCTRCMLRVAHVACCTRVAHVSHAETCMQHTLCSEHSDPYSTCCASTAAEPRPPTLQHGAPRQPRGWYRGAARRGAERRAYEVEKLAVQERRARLRHSTAQHSVQRVVWHCCNARRQ